MANPIDSTSGYKVVNGMKMYYEIHNTTAKGIPLVLIHGGGSDIHVTFGRILPLLAQNRQVIGVDLQAHGRTADRGRPSSFEQDADDVAGLLEQLNIKSADFFGFSNGGQTTMQIGIRHPALAHRLVIGSAPYQREGMIDGFWDGMAHATLDNMPQPLKDAYLALHPGDKKGLETMFTRDAYRMQHFKDWKDDDLRSIKAPSLIIDGDQDVVRPEHAVKIHRMIPNSRLIILPGYHGEYLGELLTHPHGGMTNITVTLVENFLDQAH